MVLPNIHQILSFLIIFNFIPGFKARLTNFHSNSCNVVDKSDTFGPKLLYHCYNKVIVNLIKASKATHALVEIWPLYDSDNPISFEWLPTLKGIEFLEGVSDYTISIYSTDLRDGATYKQLIEKMEVPVTEVSEVFIQGCVNFRLKELEGLSNVWRLYISGSILNEKENDVEMDLGKLFPELRLLSFKLNQQLKLPKIDSIPFLEEFILDMNEVDEIPEKYFTKNRQLTTVYINELSLTFAPRDLFEDLEYLESLVYRTSLTQLPSLKGCHELQALEIQCPEAKSLTSDLFEDVTHLQSLKLFGCDINKIEENSFQNLPELKEVDLSYNQIESLPEKLFVQNSDLKEIDLSYNSLTSFTDEFLPNSTKKLNLGFTKINFFNTTKKLENLDEIDISKSQLSGNMDIGNLTKFYPNIRFIGLSGNLLTNVTISKDFGTNRDVVTVDLMDNHITTVSVMEEEKANEGKRTKLRINLSGNPLRCDCYLRTFVQVLMKNETEKRYFHMTRDVKCSWPGNRTLFSVDLSEMVC